MPKLYQPEGKFNEHFVCLTTYNLIFTHIINKKKVIFIKQEEKFFVVCKGRTVATFAYYTIKQIFK